ncbi:ATP-binding protein [Bradyrhizobium sp. dw_78]|uniref:sensor histidine kinase n=1 Tax=Bradyrhizobium sp. dw_78 TaxID=2719793 RepID=UPI00320A9FC9
MTKALKRLIPRSLTGQVTGIVAVSVILGMIFTLAVVVFFFDVTFPGRSSSSAAFRISDITRLVRAAATPDEADTVIANARNIGFEVSRVAISSLAPLPGRVGMPVSSSLVIRRLNAEPGIEVLNRLRTPSGSRYQLIVRLDERQALVFEPTEGISLWRHLLTPTTLVLAIIMIFALLLSIYAIRWIIAPLAAVAKAAHSFGRLPQDDQDVSLKGPREIRQVADAINGMRTRIRALLDDRGRMLAAISHDLRTPLTRLRLRAERVGDAGLSGAMLGDIAQISRMLDETLDYLRDDAKAETMSKVDLPSLLQTICSDFADIGHSVSYRGPARLTWVCQPKALTRALTNIVENGLKHGHTVIAGIGIDQKGSAEIEISDDGPGIPEPLRDRVFEPFFKADHARSDGGFGLGLSIASDIVKRHGGDIALVDRAPRGLIVRITLPEEIALGAA